MAGKEGRPGATGCSGQVLTLFFLSSVLGSQSETFFPSLPEN